MVVTLLHIEGCAGGRTVEARLAALAEELGLVVERRVVATAEEAAAAGFRGSPTILVDGRDPFAAEEGPVSLSCRLYPTPSGLQGAPTLEQLREVLTAP